MAANAAAAYEANALACRRIVKLLVGNEIQMSYEIVHRLFLRARESAKPLK